jgi:hypothetical protein
MSPARNSAFFLVLLAWWLVAYAIEKRRLLAAGQPSRRSEWASDIFHGECLIVALFKVRGPYRYLAYQLLALMGFALMVTQVERVVA